MTAIVSASKPISRQLASSRRSIIGARAASSTGFGAQSVVEDLLRGAHSDSASERNTLSASKVLTQRDGSWAVDGPPPEIQIEGYEVVRELKRGGQGVVYQAFQKATEFNPRAHLGV